MTLTSWMRSWRLSSNTALTTNWRAGTKATLAWGLRLTNRLRWVRGYQSSATVGWNLFALENICDNARKPDWENFCQHSWPLSSQYTQYHNILAIVFFVIVNIRKRISRKDPVHSTLQCPNSPYGDRRPGVIRLGRSRNMLLPTGNHLCGIEAFMTKQMLPQLSWKLNIFRCSCENGLNGVD